MLETDDDRTALVRVTQEVMEGWRSQPRRSTAFYQDPGMRGGFDQDDAQAMCYAVGAFLEQIRIEPPKALVSTQIEGDGSTRRLSWRQYISDFSAK